MQLAATAPARTSESGFARLSQALRQPFVWYSVLSLGWAASFLGPSVAPAAAASALRHPLCSMLEATAQSNGLPLDFLARLIWQESRFRDDVVGPITSNGERAQGIAQFMPATAAEVGLIDPFNPDQALPKSGAFLAQLRNEFGNLGLAAAAYNAGPQRVRDFLAGLGRLPPETRQYVLTVTGRPVEDWTKPAQEAAKTKPVSELVTTMNCEGILTTLKEEAARQAALPRYNVPNWCRYLHDPNPGVCGPVHAGSTAATRRIDQRLRARVTRASFR
jgi:Transglycosylase SLT domain